MRIVGVIFFCSLPVSGALAQVDVLFNGTVGNICQIIAHTNGSLKLTGGGTQMSSATDPLDAGSVSIVSTGSNYLNIAAPTLSAGPAATQTLEVKYKGEGALSAIEEDWNEAGTSKSFTSPTTATVKIQNRITRAGGFALGSYQTSTRVSCTPTAAF